MDFPEFQQRFAEHVRGLRVRSGLRQEDLEEFGLSWKTVQKVEYGQTDPRVSTLLKLCRAFDLTLSELLQGGYGPGVQRRAMPRAADRGPRFGARRRSRKK